MPHHDPDHAIVFIPASVTDPAEFATLAAPSLERIEACGYVFAGIVRTWPDVMAMIDAGRAHVVVAASMGILPRERRPRVETVNDPVRVVPQHVVPAEATAPRVRRARRVR